MNGAASRTARETDQAHVNQAPLRALLVEDSPDDVEFVLRELRNGGFAVTSDNVQTAEDFTRQVRANTYDIILADYNLPHWRGIEALDVLRDEGLEIPLIVVSGALGDVRAVECIKRGATDYVLKDSLARLVVSVRRALAEKQLRDETKQAQKDLARKVEELARSNRDLEQFAYVASHDLQEPLRMVAAYTQLLAERYRGKLDADADKFIGYAVEGAVRMQTLILDLLAFSRVGHNGNGGKSSDCNRVMADAVLNLKAAIEESGVVINYEPLPMVAAEHAQLVQVFQNLIGNAIKFRGSEVLTISVSAQRKEAQWVFSVADNGIGIGPEYHEVIFAIFQRLHARGEYAGNGVGLAICKKIVEHYGGRIWVESETGRGAKFYFTLPAGIADVNKDHDPRSA
jgi:signal transduction histidine kinase